MWQSPASPKVTEADSVGFAEAGDSHASGASAGIYIQHDCRWQSYDNVVRTGLE